MTRIEYVYFRVRHIFPIALWFAGIKRQVVLSPKHQKLGWFSASTLAISGMSRRWFDSRRTSRFGSPPGLAGSETHIRRSRDRGRRAPHSGRPQRGVFWWQPSKADLCADRLHRRTIRPKFAPGLPIRAQAFIVSHSILYDEGLDALRMCQDHAEAYRPSIVLHVECVTVSPSTWEKSSMIPSDSGRRCSQTASGPANRCGQSRDNQARSSGTCRRVVPSKESNIREEEGNP